jgi:hydrogenase/urease accessory protein HupE
MTIAEATYLSCGVISLVAAVLLLRYYRTRRTRLLLWSCIAFVGLAINNVLVYLDLGLLPSVDLSILRTAAGACGMLALAYALATEPSA